MDLVAVSPVFNLYDTAWPIRTYQPQAPPAKTVFRGAERKGEVLDSLVSNGCIVSGGCVAHSILGPRVFVHSWAHVEDSVVFDDVEIGRHASIRRAIIEKGVRIPEGMRIGYDREEDARRFTLTESGVVVIPKGAVLENAGRAHEVRVTIGKPSVSLAS
jgi:glucose-1-phosphate adenylyltransferase